MLVGLDTEYGFRRCQRLPNGRLHVDASTMRPVCATLAFEDGREIRLADNFERLQEVFDDPRYTFVVHGAHAESGFCRRVGLRFPKKYRDTLLMAVLTSHASNFYLPGGAYKNAALSEVASRYHIPFLSAEGKDAIRESIARLDHMSVFGMDRVLEYCIADAKAVVQVYPQLHADMTRLAGPYAERNLVELYQPYALAMAEASVKGIRFDVGAWDRLVSSLPEYRGQRLAVLRDYGYDHDGLGIGDVAFARLISHLGLEADWPRTPGHKLSTKEADIKFAAARYRHPALEALQKLVAFDKFMGQDFGSLVDDDGRIRCGILPLAQRTGRTSTVSPNLMGIPGELRPLLLPDEGCRFLHFDYSQQEPGVASIISRDEGLQTDFSAGDVYVNLGLRLGLITNSMPDAEKRQIRNGVLKTLMLAILYGMGVMSISQRIGVSRHDASVLLANFQRTYPRLFSWLKRYVVTSLERGWAENIIGYRAAFNIPVGSSRGHVERSVQNFPIQSSAAACFQLAGVYLHQFGSDIRLPLHDAYLINVADDRQALLDERQRIDSATTFANNQLFPGLAVKRDVEDLSCFAKDKAEGSLEALLTTLEANQCVHI